IHPQLVATGNEGLLYGRWNSCFHREIARIHGVRKRRGWESTAGTSGSLDGLLDIHAEFDNVEEGLHCPHYLIVRARAARDHKRLPVIHHQSGLQSTAWPLARFERIGLAAGERVVVAAAVEDDAGVAHDHSGPEWAVQAGHETHHVAILVDRSNVAG